MAVCEYSVVDLVNSLQTRIERYMPIADQPGTWGLGFNNLYMRQILSRVPLGVMELRDKLQGESRKYPTLSASVEALHNWFNNNSKDGILQLREAKESYRPAGTKVMPRLPGELLADFLEAAESTRVQAKEKVS
jgi:hypothetical protein